MIPVITNRVHRRGIVRNYDEHIYTVSCPGRFSAVLEGCIRGFKSLHARAGLLPHETSRDDLVPNKDTRKPYLAFD